MQKKFMAAVISLAALCLFAPVTEAKADTDTESKTYTVDGAYKVQIPASVTIDTATKKGSLDITGTVQPYHKLDIQINPANNEYSLKCGEHEILYTISAEDLTDVTTVEKQFSYSTDGEEKNFSETITVTATNTDDATVSGDYTDTLVFTMNCQPTRTFTLTFDPNGGTMGATDSTQRELAYGQAYGTLPTPTLENCTFKGWYKEREYFKEDLVTSDSVMGSENITIYAHWGGTWNVEIDANGGRLYVMDSSIIAGASETNPVQSDRPTFKVIYNDGAYNNLLIEAVKEGYTCTGYFDQSSGGEKVWDATGPCEKDGNYYENLNGPKGAVWRNRTKPEGEVYIFYPQWKANEYTIIYKSNAEDASGETGSSVHIYDEEKSLSQNGFTRDGYIFKGWSRTANANIVEYEDKQLVKNLSTENGDTIVLYAVWEKIEPSDEESINDTTEQMIQNESGTIMQEETQDPPSSD